MEYRSHNIYFTTHKSRLVKMLLHSKLMLSHGLPPAHETVANRRKRFELYLPPGARPHALIANRVIYCSI
jgi:hypothetical protein